MLDLLLTDGDITFTDGDIDLVTGADAVKQSLLIALRLFFGEWFDDPEAGVPYFQHIFQQADTYDEGRPVSEQTVEAVLREQILAVDGVDAITSFSLEFDRATRDISVEFQAKSSYGEIAVSEVFPL